MTYNIIENQDGTSSITIEFSDEGVNLQCRTSVKGDMAAAEQYLPFFEADMRNNFADLFPLPQTPATPEGGIE